MLIAVTGATGFLGRYIVRRLVSDGHRCRCWCRPTSDRTGFGDAAGGIEWVAGDLDHPDGFDAFCRGADAVVHAALSRRAGAGFRASADRDFAGFLQANLLGSLELMAAARRQEVGRFVFISTCAVHEIVVPDRPLDEAHPLWPTSHYGAHKAAVEKFVHSFGHGEGWPVCALRPTGIYGVAHPPRASRWYELVRKVVRGEAVHCERGGKEVHAADVATAVALLVAAPAEAIRGEAFNCYDRYVAEYTVAELVREISGGAATITGVKTAPRNQIDTSKLRRLGMSFGGESLLRRTIAELVALSRCG